MSIPNQPPPEWLQELEDEKTTPSTPLSPRTVPQATMATSSTSNIDGGSRRLSPQEQSKARLLYFVMKLITLALCALMFSTACIALEHISGVANSGQIFVATYMLFFSLLLAALEVAQMQQITWLDHMLRRNFGFLFSAMGKAFFVIFIAFLCFGLDGDLPIWTGIAVAAYGGSQVVLFLKFPEYSDYVPHGYGALPETGIAGPASGQGAPAATTATSVNGNSL
jgi:hypothetical protein